MAEKKFDYAQLFTIVKAAVRFAELVMPGATGPEKREWVIQQINGKIDIPVIGERIEAAVIGVVIDVVVALLNKGAEKWDA